MRAPTRRAVLVAVAVTALSPGAPRAQQTRRTFRIGILSGQSREAPTWVAFFDELGKGGFVEGENLIVDWRVLGSRPEQYAASVAELVHLAPDVLLPASAPAMVSAQEATRAIPMLGMADDMLASGLVPSRRKFDRHQHSRNRARRQAAGDPDGPGARLPPYRRARRSRRDGGGSARDLATRRCSARGRAGDLPGPWSRGDRGCARRSAGSRRHGAQRAGLPILHYSRKIILDRTGALRLPAIYQWPETAEEGGLVAYGPRFAKVFRQLARQLVKLLRGAKPADLPVEQPTEFELVVNLKTANALGLAVPPSILARADEVIE